VRIYTWGASSWVQAGADIDGEHSHSLSGSSVSLSASGQTVAIGAPWNAVHNTDWDASGSPWGGGHVRVFSFE
jgi:hypothetical protein